MVLLHHIPVELQVGLGQVVATTISGPDGRYLVEAVPERRYTIRFGPLPAGLRSTNDSRGIGSEDSDANPYTGRGPVLVEGGRADLDVDSDVNGGGESPFLTVADGQVDLTIDGGFAPLA